MYQSDGGYQNIWLMSCILGKNIVNFKISHTLPFLGIMLIFMSC